MRRRSSWNWIFLISTFGLGVGFVVGLSREALPEWRRYQAEYHRRLAEATGDPAKARAPIEMKQIYLPDFNRVDRCVVCHAGISNPAMTGQPQPYAAHPDLGDPAFLAAHDFNKIGCTVCHGGQGRATTVEAAHGFVKHWEEPLLPEGLTVSNCAACHGDAYQLRGAEVLAQAKAYFDEKGCIGCHMLGGEGNQIGPELSETGSKALHQFDFRYVRGEHTVFNWIYEHFLDPQAVTPGDPALGIPESAMPNYEMTREEAMRLTALILSFSAREENPRRPIPHAFKVPAPPEKEPVYDNAVDAGRAVYQRMGCAACHGAGGRGGIPNKNMDLGGEVPPLIYVAAGFTAEELKETIREGRHPARADRLEPPPPLWMPAWKEKLTEEELDHLVAYLFSLNPHPKASQDKSEEG